MPANMSDLDNKVKVIVEGLLLAAGRPLSLDQIMQVFAEEERPDRKELMSVMDAINEDCSNRGFELVEVASGYRFQVKQELGEWVAKLWEEKPPRYTRALLETLSLIAYRQPITRGDIEEIRGVAVSSTIVRTLLDREWIRVVGHRDVPGRPAMFATTKQFLDYFSLKSLQELPPLSEIKDLGQSDQRPDLAADLAQQRVLDLPEEGAEAEYPEPTEAEKAQMLAEDEAIALSSRPLDEILNLDDNEPEPGENESAGHDSAAEQAPTLAQVIPLNAKLKLKSQLDTGSDSENHSEASSGESENPETGAVESNLDGKEDDALASDFDYNESVEGDDEDDDPLYKTEKRD